MADRIDVWLVELVGGPKDGEQYRIPVTSRLARVFAVGPFVPAAVPGAYAANPFKGPPIGTYQLTARGVDKDGLTCTYTWEGE